MTRISKQHFTRAIKNIGSHGDTDIFPLPIENLFLYDSVDPVADFLHRRSNQVSNDLNTRTPANYSTLSPVGFYGYRWATQIDPIWNAHYLGSILSLQDSIEDARIAASENVVFSHRLVDNNEDHSLFAPQAWKDFQETSLALSNDYNFVVTTDISNFYDRVYHHRVENEISYLKDPESKATAKDVNRLLSSFSQNVSYGLPVGGPASRIVSEVLLNSTDQSLTAHGSFRFTRFADDYRIFVNTVQEAQVAIAKLSEKLQRSEGLSLQRSKTRVMTSAEFIEANSLTEMTAGSADKFLSLHIHFDPYSPTAEEDYEDLKEKLAEFDILELLREEISKGRIDQALTRKLIQAIKHLPPDSIFQALTSLIDNLDRLAPVTPQILRSIRDNMSSINDDAAAHLCSKIRDLVVAGHPILSIDLNLSFIVQILSRGLDRASEHLLLRIYQGPHGHSAVASPDIQRSIILAMGRHEVQYALHDFKSSYPSLHPWAKRAFYVSSFALGDAGNHWRSSVSRGFNEPDSLFAEWAKTKASLSDWAIPV